MTYTVTVTVTNEDEDEIYSEETYLETPKEGDSNEELLDMCSVIGDLGLDNCWFETSILEDCGLELRGSELNGIGYVSSKKDVCREYYKAQYHKS